MLQRWRNWEHEWKFLVQHRTRRCYRARSGIDLAALGRVVGMGTFLESTYAWIDHARSFSIGKIPAFVQAGPNKFQTSTSSCACPVLDIMI